MGWEEFDGDVGRFLSTGVPCGRPQHLLGDEESEVVAVPGFLTATVLLDDFLLGESLLDGKDMVGNVVALEDIAVVLLGGEALLGDVVALEDDAVVGIPSLVVFALSFLVFLDAVITAQRDGVRGITAPLLSTINKKFKSKNAYPYVSCQTGENVLVHFKRCALTKKTRELLRYSCTTRQALCSSITTERNTAQSWRGKIVERRRLHLALRCTVEPNTPLFTPCKNTHCFPNHTHHTDNSPIEAAGIFAPSTDVTGRPLFPPALPPAFPAGEALRGSTTLVDLLASLGDASVRTPPAPTVFVTMLPPGLVESTACCLTGWSLLPGDFNATEPPLTVVPAADVVAPAGSFATASNLALALTNAPD